MTAAELREQAVAKFREANALVEGKEIADIDAETEQKFDTLMTEAAALDDQFVKLAGKEGKVATLKERLDFYTKAATGKGIDWSKVTGGDEGPAKGLPHYDGGLIIPGTGKSLGDLFVDSEEYKDLLGQNVLNSDSAKFKSEPFSPEIKATTDILRSAAGGTATSLVLPQYLPGILPLPQRPLTVRDLFSQATTTSDTLSYARQNAFDNGAAAVAEATTTADGAKPQSSIAWTRETSPIETIATWMAATRRALADAGQIRSLIDNQLTLMLQLEEEDQLLNGDGTSPNISGLLDHTLQTLDLSAAAGDRANLDGLRTAKRLVRTGAARAQADGVVLNPVDSEEFDLMVDNEGRYRAGDPFGSGTEAPPIWRMRRVESEAVAAGTAIVGAFRQGATVFQRQGITILSSDSHSDFFVRNLIAVLAEERLGLAVFFPTAFVEVTLKAWPTS